VRQEWLVRELDREVRGLDLALRLKEAQPGTEVTAIHLGPAGNEPCSATLLLVAVTGRCGVGLGSRQLGAAGKAVILAAPRGPPVSI